MERNANQREVITFDLHGYGKSKERFAEDIKDKTNIVMMTDEEYKEYIKAKRLYRVIKKEEL